MWPPANPLGGPSLRHTAERALMTGVNEITPPREVRPNECGTTSKPAGRSPSLAHCHAGDRDLIAVRWKLARTLGASCRQLWRRDDMDEVVCDLVAEALARLSRLLKGPSGTPAREVLMHAPHDKRQTILKLAGLASRPKPEGTSAGSETSPSPPESDGPGLANASPTISTHT